MSEKFAMNYIFFYGFYEHFGKLEHDSDNLEYNYLKTAWFWVAKCFKKGLKDWYIKDDETEDDIASKDKTLHSFVFNLYSLNM